MERIKMSKDILNVINVVLDYKKFLASYHYHILKDKKYDIYEEAEKFYYSLELPQGMNKNKMDFETIIDYGRNGYINELNVLEEDELSDIDWRFC